MATQKFTNVLLTHADMTVVTIQSIKIVLNEVKDNLTLLEPSYGKNQTNFLANPILWCLVPTSTPTSRDKKEKIPYGHFKYL